MLVAGKFEKNHKDVIRSIKRQLEVGAKLRQHCVPTTYVDEQGKENPLYILDRDGFTFISMGFTGKKASDFKWDFIEAFNKMEALLISMVNNQIKRANDSAKRRWYLTSEKKELDATISRCMERRKEVVKELNRINADDFQQLSLDIFDIDESKMSIPFPNKAKMLKIS